MGDYGWLGEMLERNKKDHKITFTYNFDTNTLTQSIHNGFDRTLSRQYPLSEDQWNVLLSEVKEGRKNVNILPDSLFELQ